MVLLLLLLWLGLGGGKPSFPACRWKKVPGFTQATDVMALPPPLTKVEQATKTRKTRKPSISPERGKSRNSETKRMNLEKRGTATKVEARVIQFFRAVHRLEESSPPGDPADRRRPSGSCREGHKRGSRGMETEEQVLLCRGNTDGQLRSHGVWGRGRQHGDGDAGEKGTGRGPAARTVGLQLSTTPTSAGREDGLPAHGQPSHQFSRPQPAVRLPPTSGDSPARI